VVEAVSIELEEYDVEPVISVGDLECSVSCSPSPIEQINELHLND
jgi:hypothetical protein